MIEQTRHTVSGYLTEMHLTVPVQATPVSDCLFGQAAWQGGAAAAWLLPVNEARADD